MSIVPSTWHAPAGYRVVTTNERVYTDSQLHFSRFMAERAAAGRNDHRTCPSFEWRVEKVGRRFRLVAFQNKLVSIEELAAA